MKRSIRGRLLALLLPLVAVVWTAGVLGSYLETRSELNELFDRQEQQLAAGLLRADTHASIAIPPFPDDDNPDLADLPRRFRILAPGGGRVLSSQPLHTGFPAWHSGFPALTDIRLDGRGWRLATVQDGDGRVAQVAESLDARNDVTEGIATQLLMPLWILLPLLGVAIWLGVGQGVGPLNRLARVLRERRPNNLEPLDDKGLPSELRPMVAALNDLFARLLDAFQRERQFTADAAHELRTPLAALRVHTQLAQRAVTGEERRAALDGVLQGVDRVTHLLSQLLTLARVDPDVPLTVAAVAPGTVARELFAELRPMAEAKGIILHLEDDPEAQIQADRGLVAVILRNLLDNAIRYGPPRQPVTVRVRGQAEGTDLIVCDRGPGIPAPERERVFDRFYRVLGTEEEGSGLGLAIVSRICARLGAPLRLEDAPGGGLCVQIRFRPVILP